jgi:hypothetical protein
MPATDFVPDHPLWLIIAELSAKNPTIGTPQFSVFAADTLIVDLLVQADSYDEATHHAHDQITAMYSADQRYNVFVITVERIDRMIAHHLIVNGELFVYPMSSRIANWQDQQHGTRTVIRPLDLECAKDLRQGEVIHPIGHFDADGLTPQRYRITSIKTWKRSPNRIEIRAQRGLYEYVTITEHHVHNWYRAR